MRSGTSSDPFVDQLSDYMDGTLEETKRNALDAHLKACPSCTAILDELRSIRLESRALPPIDPPAHIWNGIEERLRTDETSERRRSRYHTGLAIAAALVLGMSLWIAVQPAPEPQTSEELANEITGELRAAEVHYENAITGLEQIIRRNEGSLPSGLKQTVNESLDLIEQTIDESRDAIRTQPESTAAQESLLEAFRRKVSLLQSTILLINEVRKGEGQNALELIDEIRDTEDPSNPS